MINFQLPTRPSMLACGIVLCAVLAGCGSDYKSPSSDTYAPTPTVSPTAQFIGVVSSTINTANPDTMEPASVDPTAAPTSESEEPVPVT